MWRDDAQAATACRILLELARMDGLFTDKGPTERARSLLRTGTLSTGEFLILKCAFVLWSGKCLTKLDGSVNPNLNPTFDQLVDVLDVAHLERIFTLVIAIKHGSAYVDDWIADHEKRTR